MASDADFANRFGVVDYVIFILMLSASACIGFYYACSGSRQKTAGEFLMANRNMGVLPISLSLLASFLSAIGLLGIPVEIYTYGTSYWCMVFGFLLVIPLSAHVYLPVFYHLRLTSAYEYLERRFSRSVRRCGSVIFIFQMLMYMSMVTYAPSLALSQVTGLHVWGSVAAIGVVCTLYTTVGGMKAVMWTDVVQIMVMLSAMLAVIIQGIILVGGFSSLIELSDQGGRLATFNFDPDVTVRHTFWNLVLGGSATWIAIYGVNQTQVQRYLTAPSLRSAQAALWWNLVGLFVSISVCTLTGLVIYSYYAKCDPLSAKVITSPDQLLPLLVMEILGKYPGLPGFFVAGIFSGSLSTLSSGLNSLAAVTLEDFVRPLCLKNLSDERAGIVSKCLALGYGVLALALVAVVEQLGNILQAAISIFGIVGGPLLGVFTLGMFFPWANAIGALSGLLIGLGFALWIGLGAQFAKIPKVKLPVSVSQCPNNVTLFSAPILDVDVLPIYKLSYQWYSTVALCTVIVVGLIISFITGYNDPEKMDARLLCAPVRKLAQLLPNSLRDLLRLNLNRVETEQNKQEVIGQPTTVSVVEDGKENPAFQEDEKSNNNGNSISTSRM